MVIGYDNYMKPLYFEAVTILNNKVGVCPLYVLFEVSVALYVGSVGRQNARHKYYLAG